MSTREGNIVKVNELLKEAISRIQKIIEEKNPEMVDKEENARKIGVGAVIFNNLCTTLIKDQVFDWDTALSFQGETGPYIQYVYVRAKSVLEKIGFVPSYKDVDISLISDESSLAVLSCLYNFESVLEQITKTNETSVLTRYLIDLSQSFTLFYNENKILDSDEKTKNARAYLTYAVKTVIETGAGLMGIEMPTQM